MGKVLSKDGTGIAFDRSGEGPAIILVDGALCYRAFGPMVPLAALLARRFTVFTYDRRGRGASGDTAPFAKEREIEDLEALIAEAGGSAFVSGISSGAVLSLEAAAHGLAITKLVLYEPPFIIDGSRPPLPEDYKAQLTRMIASSRGGDAVALFMTQVGARSSPVRVPAPLNSLSKCDRRRCGQRSRLSHPRSSTMPASWKAAREGNRSPPSWPSGGPRPRHGPW